MAEKDLSARASSYNHNEKISVAVSKLIHHTWYKYTMDLVYITNILPPDS